MEPPEPFEVVEINGVKMICADIFRATGTTFFRMVPTKHLGDLRANRYVAGSYFTATELFEVQ